MPGFLHTAVGLLPISSYPVTRTWRRPRHTITLLGISSLLVYGGLTIWNILTQGKEAVFKTVLLDAIPTNKPSIQCQVRNLQVGDIFYTSPTGVFAWSVTGVDSGDSAGFDVGANYAGAKLQANVTRMTMVWLWSMQSFQYDVCANATVPQIDGIDKNGNPILNKDANGQTNQTVISMCSHFDLASAVPPTWAAERQANISDSFYDLSAYFQTLNFPNNTFPICSFPPYCKQSANFAAPEDTTITPANAYDLTIWMDVLSYTPETTGSIYTDSNGISLGDEHGVFVPGNSTKTTLVDAFEETYVNGTGTSGINMGVTGIGALHLLTQAQNAANGFNEPTTITKLRSASLGVLNIIADYAVKDLNDRVIGSSYLCTESDEHWKSIWSLIALVLGNNSSLFGVWLAFSVSAMRKWDETRYGPVASSERPIVIPTLRQDSATARLPRFRDKEDEPML
ncbi:hypothetical protein PUNSTDRAFT_110729 [Punctularia strigosozonata HHB-11173 SS5]|uniref:uncharacterized protein n=1 Tax=Punctularia strigosozonata (strain HHB-11173) TaxID=741275 RepID=UPI0004417534|nr:uncharacterized protein PUNSTDRAFT_110729 [Punctularia strigosozonata HHB-11173 SS5]EIN14699.1 hypothetical protein PUNSTDRAFT_110729 [Punctularia strigosozonata HHB-11173 SS5]